MAAAVATTQLPHTFEKPVEEPIESTHPRRQNDVSTIINYYKDPGDGSLPMPIVIANNTVKNERPHTPRQVTIHDVTGEEEKYFLDSHGFQYLRHESKLKSLEEFQDEETVRSRYYPESVRLLKEITGAPHVFIFDHKTRCGPSNWHKLGKGNRSSRGPLFRAHVDQSYDGAELVLRRWFPDSAEDLLKRRYQIINLWRPIKPILKDPFATADATSIPDEDLVAAGIVYPRDRDETWTIKPGSTHRWYYKHSQQPSDVLLIKCFDSDTTIPARRAPHSAFEDPEQEGAGARESIETRALLFYK
ncbi:uncharacterized protein GGS22DRAFT_184342 [Annulohypoxylon maeteangense]|uniref:uncharacterized protein n=1 Tax=Annulohypoxylon maeteangense TaxID=1927788 RepID=UPI002007503C|nr:uncharacterized protein GGS22DRAFT_184342 [Annulohypoxylon maeteangense]KAI0888763.1 hypothetical protein GGS22DRAFT_184342 [Annulohypoxylon maeteangense]